MAETPDTSGSGGNPKDSKPPKVPKDLQDDYEASIDPASMPDFSQFETPGPELEPVVSEPEPPQPVVVGPVSVLSHVHDAAAGVYQIVIGNTLLQGGDQVGVTNVRDFVFADDDERWFTQDGERRAHDAIATEQRVIIKSAITPPPEASMPTTAAAAAASGAETPDAGDGATTPVELPGVGDEL